MSLYRVKTDCFDDIYVEAENFSRALVVWHTWARAEYGEDYHENNQPTSLELVSDEMVWRDDALDITEIEIEGLSKKNETLDAALLLACRELAVIGGDKNKAGAIWDDMIVRGSESLGVNP